MTGLVNKQTYSVSGQQFETKGFSGVSYIDALLNRGDGGRGGPIKWASDPYLTEEGMDNSITTISYSFPSGDGSGAAYSYLDDAGEISPIAFNSKQREDIRAALNEVEKYINVKFVEVIEGAESVGTIRFAMNTITDEAGNYREGIAATADPVGTEPRSGDVFFNKWFVLGDFSDGLVRKWVSGSETPGSQTGIGDATILYHEIFHSLGIEHPNDNPDKPFPAEKNFREYSVMAGEFSVDGASSYYVDGKDYAIASTPMAYDIAALQHLYGANLKHNSGDTVYTFDPNTPEIKLIWDGAGTDTLNFTNFSESSTINLNGGSYSTVQFNGWSLKNNISIAFGAVIENVITGSGADVIIGNSSNNVITGGAGGDTIDGDAGIDQAVYTENFTDVSLVKSGNDWNITSGTDIDTLTNIERLKFNDKYIALDLDGNAGKIIKLLGLILGKDQSTNKEYVGIGLKLLDDGMSYEQLMQAALDVVLGANASSLSVVEMIWENLVGPITPVDNIRQYSALIDIGIYTSAGLALAAADHNLNTTAIDLVGLASTGVEYII